VADGGAKAGAEKASTSGRPSPCGNLDQVIRLLAGLNGKGLNTSSVASSGFWLRAWWSPDRSVWGAVSAWSFTNM